MGRALLIAVLSSVVLAPVARATDPASTYDAPGQSHANVCVHLAASSAPLRYGDATATGFQLANNLTFDNGDCPDGTVRLDNHEVIPSGSGPLVFHRGGNGYTDDQNVKYGALATADLGDVVPPPVPSSGGRGAACPIAPGNAYKVQVESIPDVMHYKRPQDVPGGSNQGASYEHYGDPGADQGSRHDIHYSYLLWSWLDVQGGGHVRALLKQGDPLAVCDVAPITLPSWDRAGNLNGEVTARYVRLLAGSCPIYGWMVWTHQMTSGGVVDHALPTSSPPPEPAPDPSCPVAAPASPPVVTTGPSQPGVDGGWAVTGTVDPVGTPAAYRFDYGTTALYGFSTAGGGVVATDQARAVSDALAGLQPATTYHYRVVATSIHGTTYGADATFTTAPPPVPPRPVLGGLRVSPSRFHRAKKRRGIKTHVRFTLSAPARVTLTFERRVVGMTRGGRCRPLPRDRRVPNRLLCWRWPKVRGSLHVSAKTGRTSVRFGGWLGARKLPAGRWRVKAVPVANKQTGSARRAGFTLKR